MSFEVIQQLCARISELERKTSGFFSIGEIEEISGDGHEARVRLGKEVVSGFLPLMVRRAGRQAKEKWTPERGEQVFVVSPSGEPSHGVILGSIHSRETKLPQGISHYVQNESGFSQSYDKASNTLRVDFKPGGAPGKLKIDVEGGEVALSAKSISFEGETPPVGVVTGECLCAFTGAAHPDVSLQVKASKK